MTSWGWGNRLHTTYRIHAYIHGTGITGSNWEKVILTFQFTYTTFWEICIPSHLAVYWFGFISVNFTDEDLTATHSDFHYVIITLSNICRQYLWYQIMTGRTVSSINRPQVEKPRSVVGLLSFHFPYLDGNLTSTDSQYSNVISYYPLKYCISGDYLGQFKQGYLAKSW